MLTTHFSYSELRLLAGLPAAYLEHSMQLNALIDAFPSIESISRKAHQKVQVFAHRNALVDSLNEQYQGLSLSTSVGEHISALAHPNTVTITTGHQICLTTGPLFFIYKIASTIALANRMNAQNDGLRYVPVFWMATEDHDLEEVNHIYVQGNKWSWPTHQKGAVGRMNMHGADALLALLESLPGDAARKEKWMNTLRLSFAMPTWAQATRFLVNELFGHHGLVIIDGDDARLKACFAEIVQHELMGSHSKQAVENATAVLAKLGYTGQVQPRDINLFYLNDGLRERIERTEDRWTVNKTSLAFTQEQWKEELAAHPERFSPNVVLRPVYQEVILPNAAYIGGPGEVNYWLQLKGVFEKFQVPFPIVVLRNNALLITQGMQHRMAKTGYSLAELFGDADALRQQIIGKSADDLLSEERLLLAQLFSQIAAKLSAVDATLQAATMAEGKKADSGLEHLGKKAIRALKTKEETRLRQLDRVLQELKPDGKTQDRVANIFEFLFAWSDDQLINALIENLDPLQNNYTVFTDQSISG